MNLEEREQLTRFLQLLGEAQAGAKDPEAEALIRAAIARQPDADYLLVQRVMQLEMSLLQAQAELAQLRQQAAEARTSGLPPSFFSGNAWGRRSAEAAAPAAAQAQAPVAAAAPVGVPQQAQPSRWGSGLMGTVASTAVGVVAGSMIAQGIGSLFGGHHGNAGSAATDSSAVPPGGGTLVDTDYGAGGSNDGYIADDFDPGGSGDAGDVG